MHSSSREVKTPPAIRRSSPSYFVRVTFSRTAVIRQCQNEFGVDRLQYVEGNDRSFFRRLQTSTKMELINLTGAIYELKVIFTWYVRMDVLLNRDWVAVLVGHAVLASSWMPTDGDDGQYSRSTVMIRLLAALQTLECGPGFHWF